MLMCTCMQHAKMHARAHTHTHTHKHTHTYTHTHTHTLILKYTCTCTHTQHTHTLIHTFTHTQTYTLSYTDIIARLGVVQPGIGGAPCHPDSLVAGHVADAGHRAQEVVQLVDQLAVHRPDLHALVK